MTFILNGLIVLLILLIAYWWANQGLFSAILHLVCVIAAGAVALAFFEPLTVGLLLRGNRFDDYAWGFALVGLFVVSLLAFRLASDKIIRANVNVPHWANFAFGLPVGACSAIIALGIFMLGSGMIQSYNAVLDYRGDGRSPRTGQVEYLGPTLWAPVHRWTNEFYNYLSVGALHPTFSNTPLLHQNPDLFRQASLLRDSFGDGKGKLSLAPNAVTIHSLAVDPETNRHLVSLEFGPVARDFGEQLTLSRSQIRLICKPTNDLSRPVVAHPIAWWQRIPDGTQQMRRFQFDSINAYVTSVPGGERTPVRLEFSVPQGHSARYLQVRGTRFALPAAREAEPHEIQMDIDEFLFAREELGVGPDITQFVEISNSIRPVYASTNQQLGTLRLVDNYLFEGQHLFPARGDRPTRALMINGIYEPPMTRVVQVRMRSGDQHSIFSREVRRRVTERARLMLVDDTGNAYHPIGYIYEARDGVTVRLEPTRFLPTFADFPIMPEGGNETLRILFLVTERVRIRGFKFGDLTMGLCNVQVAPPDATHAN